ncbi:hypothetical protein PFMC_05964, partial [Plasmodium falciparum CAMP/Malaysia]
MKKYINEASVSTTRRAAPSNINYEGYESKFYKIFKGNYSGVNSFLGLLSKEKACKDITDNDGGTIHFEKVNSGSTNGDGGGTSGGTSGDSGTNDKEKGTFYRSKYCQPCPHCGVKKKSNGGSGNQWEEKHDSKVCKSINLYKPKNPEKGTPIEILKSGEGETEIGKKLNEFCEEKNGESLYDPWKCYKEDDIEKHGEDDDDDADGNPLNAGGLCILQNTNKKNLEDPAEFQKTFHDFFYYWVAHMLKDSIHWRTKRLSKCINNGKKECIKNCNDKCKCYERWAKRKEKEWTAIKDHFKKQKGLDSEGDNSSHPSLYLHMTPDFVLQENLKLEFLNEGSTQDTQNSLDAEELKHLKHLSEILQQTAVVNGVASASGVSGIGGVTEQKTLMDKLIDYEEDEADLCLQTHEDEDEGVGNDECDDDHEAPPIFRLNPCAKPSGSAHRALANEAAHQMHELAKLQLTSRGRRKALKANATKGEYKKNGTALTLSDICSITNDHSNANRNHTDQPCKGKDYNSEMFKLENVWKSGAKISEKHPLDVFLPPRREHFCTSNLEHLNTNVSGLTGPNAIHSLLGDVLLAAKEQANFIKGKYKKGNTPDGFSDDATKCRAMKYSFADLRDIIKGTDLWDQNSGEITTQNNLVQIFKQIKEKLPPDTNNNYNGTDSISKLRKDWWEANRHQVWRAMKCHIGDLKDTSGYQTPSSHCGYSRGTPPDDYIPQRLRWMTEWAEWYCKMQSQEYDTLQKACKECKDKGQCTRGTEGCKTCTAACEKYTTEIKKWQKQWNNMLVQYILLYEEARLEINNGKPSAYGDSSDQQVIAFFKELQKSIKSSASKRSKRSLPRDTSTPYSTAAGYIHQELPNMDCQKQNQFCEKENGDNSNSGKTNEKYAFREKPYDHEKACVCKDKKVPTHLTRTWPKFTLPEMFPKRIKQKTPCQIATEILRTNNGKSKVGECHPKNNNKNYPEWNCTNKIKPDNDGACMPPRRQKLCLYYLTQLSNDAKEQHLREAFIKTAAAETFLSWHYFKTKNGDNAQRQLKAGKIPPEFLRSMFNTYGDYRDLFLEKDISSEVHTIKDNINKVFTKSVRPRGETSDTKRLKWWNEHGHEIWEGMLCALSYDTEEKNVNTQIRQRLTKYYDYKYVTFSVTSATTLEKFASRPQFLRWFTEWGEHFCKEQKNEFDILKGKCESCKVSDSSTSDGNKTCNDKEKCEECKSACGTYNTFITKWKGYYDKQKDKFKKDKDRNIYKYVPEAHNSANARYYLKTQLQNILCTNGITSVKCEYKCMEDKSTSSTDDMPKSLDYPPEKFKDICNCKDKPEPEPTEPADKPATEPQDDKEVKPVVPPALSSDEPSFPMNDILSITIPFGIALALGSIAFLFIK